jgi:hypothetical protein
MASIADFVGNWQIGWVDSEKGWLQQGWLLLIGTGSGWGDSQPFLTAEYAVCAGFAILAPDADGNYTDLKLSTDDHEGHQPLVLRLTGDQLRWKGYYRQEGQDSPQPVYIYISTAETWVPDGRSYTHLYGSTTYGDPDQVGVWGASSAPPPPPPPPSPKQDEGQEA